MTPLQKNIRTAQRLLWLNRWFRSLAGWLAVGAFCFGGFVLLQRLFGWSAPVWAIGGGVIGMAVAVSVIISTIRRETAVAAAAKLDEAAGMRERISSGLLCQDIDDPYAQAVVVDAEKFSSSLSVRRHLRVVFPREFVWTGGAVLLAASMFLITPGLLKSTQAKEENQTAVETAQAKLVVKKELDSLKKLAESTPALEDFKQDLDDFDKQAGGLRKPDDVRHEAAKKIDSLADALKKEKESGRYDSLDAMKKMMRGIKAPKDENAPTEKLANALKQGDFKAAKEEAEALREQLATLKADEDKDLVDKLSKQLDDLAKQLENAADVEKLAKQLEEAGIKKEDLERMLQNLKKEDIDQIRKQLEEKGLSKQQIEKIAKQLQQKGLAGKMAKQLASKLGQASKSAAAGQMADASEGLAQAADQLSDLEKLGEEMSQLESAMAAVGQAQGNLGQGCSQCKGTGTRGGQKCSACGGSGNRPGSGMGGLGQVRGGLASEEETKVGFKTEKGKVTVGKGATIGQFLFQGEQVKGDVEKDFSEVVSAAERDASDQINRDRIPRHYQKAVKSYFSSVQRSLRRDQGGEKAPMEGKVEDSAPEKGEAEKKEGD